jgi:glutamate/tyrosine decarboxylase-like PLP-dependent enzyme
MDMAALAELLEKEDIGTVVATIGTTATGSVDPLVKILDLRERHGFRIHADAAYGGYFILTDNLGPATREVYDHVTEADSIAIDPHKHGLQPYGCGCVLFKDPSVGRFYKHDSPYTYFTSSDLHLGEISLECSRPGSSAVALWATQRLFPLVRGGEFARNLAMSRDAALDLFAKIRNDSRFMTGLSPELDIVVWAMRAESASEASRLAAAVFHEAAANQLHMAMANLPKSLFADYWPGLEWDQDHVTCLRTCLMKPEHLEWMPRIWAALDACVNKVLG